LICLTVFVQSQSSSRGLARIAVSDAETDGMCTGRQPLVARTIAFGLALGVRIGPSFFPKLASIGRVSYNDKILAQETIIVRVNRMTRSADPPLKPTVDTLTFDVPLQAVCRNPVKDPMEVVKYQSAGTENEGCFSSTAELCDLNEHRQGNQSRVIPAPASGFTALTKPKMFNLRLFLQAAERLRTIACDERRDRLQTCINSQPFQPH